MVQCQGRLTGQPYIPQFRRRGALRPRQANRSTREALGRLCPWSQVRTEETLRTHPRHRRTTEGLPACRRTQFISGSPRGLCHGIRQSQWHTAPAIRSGADSIGSRAGVYRTQQWHTRPVMYSPRQEGRTAFPRLRQQ